MVRSGFMHVAVIKYPGFALPLIAQTVTGSPAQATLLDSIMTLISSVLRLPGGVVQDKYDRENL